MKGDATVTVNSAGFVDGRFVELTVDFEDSMTMCTWLSKEETQKLISDLQKAMEGLE